MHANQYVHLTTSWNGEGFLNGRLDPESAAIVRSALDMIAEEIFRSDRHATIQSIANGDDPPAARTPSERDAEALVELARRAMATTAAADEGATVTPSRPTVVVHIDVDAHGEVLARLANGAPFPTHDAVRLACDAAVTRALSRNGSVPVDLGRTTREPSEAQRRALGTLWATCAHPSCDRPYAWCQLHHVWHWSQGGPTDIAWLLPLCSTHHRLHHRGVFDIARRPDGTFVFERPDGREIGAANPTITRLLAALRALGRTG